MTKTREELKAAVTSVLEEYLAHDLAFGDNALLEVDPSTLEVAVADGDTVAADAPADYYDVMDLLEMSTEAPGQWAIDPEALMSLLEDYFGR